MSDSVKIEHRPGEHPPGVGAIRRALSRPSSDIEDDARRVARAACRWWGDEAPKMLARALEVAEEWANR